MREMRSSALQRSRRADPYPLTWEIPAGVLAGLVLMLMVGVHSGRAVANLFAGGGLTWPVSSALLTSLPHVVAGDAAAGLAHPPAHLASVHAVQIWIGLVEAVFVISAGWVGVAGLRRWGPWRVDGMATRTEAERLLGTSRLRTVRAVVRPDLYGKDRP